MSPRLNVVPASITDEPASTLFVYAMSSRSNARHAAPTDFAAQSETRASARITPIGRSRPSIAPIEVAALEEVREPVVLLDPEVELEVVLHDLGRDVFLRPRVVRERQHDEL